VESLSPTTRFSADWFEAKPPSPKGQRLAVNRLRINFPKSKRVNGGNRLKPVPSE
jgi:hypothetical protein